MFRRTALFSVLILVLICIGSPTFSEEVEPMETVKEKKPLVLSEIGRDEGLKDLSVSSIIQDRDGFMWFGTQGGLHKYDGRDMVVYRTNPFQSDGIVHNLIQTMFYDEYNHTLWLGTYQGISKLDITSNTFTNYTMETHGLSNNIIVAITKDSSGDMWFGTMNGLNRLNPITEVLESYDISEEVVRSLLVDSKGRLLVGTYNGMWAFDYADNELDYIDIEYLVST